MLELGRQRQDELGELLIRLVNRTFRVLALCPEWDFDFLTQLENRSDSCYFSGKLVVVEQTSLCLSLVLEQFTFRGYRRVLDFLIVQLSI